MTGSVSPADGGTTELAEAEAWARGMVEREPWYAGRDELARLLAGLASLRRELSESLTAQARLAGATPSQLQVAPSLGVAPVPCPSCATAAAAVSHNRQITDSAASVGDRVRLRSLSSSVGTVVQMLPTPNFGPVPLVAWDDMPDYAEPHGAEELEAIGSATWSDLALRIRIYLEDRERNAEIEASHAYLHDYEVHALIGDPVADVHRDGVARRMAKLLARSVPSETAQTEENETRGR